MTIDFVVMLFLFINHFKPIMKEVGLDNFAELDAVLYDAMLNTKI